MPEQRSASDARSSQLREVNWSDIDQPGSYLHIASGLIARIHPEEISGYRIRQPGSGVGPVVLLERNPNAALSVLREIAERHGYRVSF